MARQVDALLTEMRIEQALAALRAQRGVSQRQLARRLGVSQPVIAKIEATGHGLPGWPRPTGNHLPAASTALTPRTATRGAGGAGAAVIPSRWRSLPSDATFRAEVRLFAETLAASPPGSGSTRRPPGARVSARRRRGDRAHTNALEWRLEALAGVHSPGPARFGNSPRSGAGLPRRLGKPRNGFPVEEDQPRPARHALTGSAQPGRRTLPPGTAGPAVAANKLSTAASRGASRSAGLRLAGPPCTIAQVSENRFPEGSPIGGIPDGLRRRRVPPGPGGRSGPGRDGTRDLATYEACVAN